MTRLLVRCASVAVALVVLVVGAGRANARDDDDRGVEAKNMKLVGFNDLQARSAYQPIVHEQGGRSIAYLGSDGTGLATATPSFPNWRTTRMTQIFDLSNPADPKFIRNYGLVGQQPGATGANPTGVHGMIELGDRLYFGHGTGSNGIMQIVDRTKLLDATQCATPPSANFRTNPTDADLLCPQLGRLDTSPTMGAHTVFPVIQQPVPDFAASPNRIRDFIFMVNEAGGNKCSDNRQMVYVVDITTPSKPMGIANFHVLASI